MDQSQRLRVFVSYARLDGSALAEELCAGLELLGFVPVIDRQDIAAAEDWEQRLDALIRQADTVLFLLSERSVKSPRCAWEVARAVELSKRIVPVIVTPVLEADVPDALRKLNFIDFGPGQSFARSLARLSEALRLDLTWIREHTRLAELAGRWMGRGRDEALLLRGAELAAAQEWLSSWHAGAPTPTDAQRLLISTSAEAAVARESVERQRLEEMAQANVARAEALLLRESALKSLRRRTLIGGTAAGALSIGLSVVGYLYVRAAQEREEERQRAKKAAEESVALAVKREAMRTDLEGQVVAYAALPGQMAGDDSGFTRGLLSQLKTGEVPLSTALSRTVRQVIDKTKGSQRPYIASDLNGDVYFRLAPPSRKQRAVVVVIDHLGEMPLPGARADGEAWASFFRECKFDLQFLLNPKRDEVIGALYSVRSAALSVSSSMVVPTAAGGSASGPSSTAATERPKVPPPNTFFAFYFAGSGFRIGELEYLAMVDHFENPRLPEATDEAVAATAVKVSDISRMLRDNFAAACLILDTNFLQVKKKS